MRWWRDSLSINYNYLLLNYYMDWQPISLEELYDDILSAESEMRGEVERLWELVKIFPEKWQQDPYGNEGAGFWVVAVCGRRIIWYNDIEEGFNISRYETYGHFTDYWCNQQNLQWAVRELLSLIQFGGDLSGQASPPQALS
jgi:hypothetical protein